MTRRVSYLRARFNRSSEFVEDLIADRDDVERGIVRLTTVRRPIHAAAVTRLEVHAGAIVAGRPVVLEVVVGDLWGHADDQAVLEAAERILAELTARLEAVGLTIRAGVLEANDEA